MKIIEPCCAQRHLREVRDAIGKNGEKEFEGYGDLSLTELLPAILTRYSETEMIIVAPTMPDQAAEVITKWMRKQWARMDGKGKLDVIRHLTIIADLGRRKSPEVSRWKKENPFGERLTLIDRQQDETAIVLPDFAITGPVNMQYGENFTATATTKPERVAELWEQYGGMTELASTEATEEMESTETPDADAPGVVATGSDADAPGTVAETPEVENPEQTTED